MEQKGLLASLFDMSFSEFVTPRVIKLLFGLGILFSGLWVILLLGAGFSQGAGPGLLALILSPLVFFLAVLGARVWCEMVIVGFRIADNTTRVVEQGGVRPPESSPTPADEP